MKIEEKNELGCYFRSWICESPKAAFIIIHGLGEHCQRYDHVAQSLTEHGYSVYSMDLAGHGKSEGPRGHLESFDQFIQATLGLVNKIKQDQPKLPRFILGHSMGGLIVSRFLLEYQSTVNGALLSGAAIQSPQEPPAWQITLIKGIAKLFPTAKMLKLDASEVSRDPAVVDKYMNDPLVNKDKLSAQFLVQMTHTMETVKREAHIISLPILIMHGSDDSITAPEGSTLLLNACSSADKKLTLYDGLFHEILNEPEQGAVIDDIIHWVDNQLSNR